MSGFIRAFHESGILIGAVNLPASKSESNRVLIINALSGNKSKLHNLSSAHDTVLMQQLLASAAPKINTEDAGTVMRFLTAYFTITNQQKTLTGSARMQERPIGLLVEALREIGADIEFKGHEGYPPLQINGIDLSWPAQEVSVSGQISSQFISALLLVAPLLPDGLKIQILPPVLSWPYIHMTTQIMQHFGAKINTTENTIAVSPAPYSPADFTVEADWSAAGYWFAMAAMATKASVTLQNLRAGSLQPDSIVVEIIKRWGVETEFAADGILIKKNAVARPPDYLTLDFSACPDLAQTILVLSAATGVKLKLTGLESLRIKETDRIA
ncbi:MAG: 3-phosphoshikimate 1-carboxyvinyltransferase, partial [Moraxellaceae bacterium]